MFDEDTIQIVSKAFAANIKKPEDIILATESAIKVIVHMDLCDADKETLCTACIEAASSIDRKKCPDLKAIIDAFENNLSSELDYRRQYSLSM